MADADSAESGGTSRTGLRLIIDFESRNGNTAKAVSAARRLLLLDNLNEEAHRSLMRILAAAGKRSAALEQYKTCRRLLAVELDAEPDEETAELAEQIRKNQAAPQPRTSALREPEPRRSDVYYSTGNLNGNIYLTKLSPPRIRSERVDRSRLFPLLDSGRTRRLTLISAPAGFGKTTILIDWLNCRGAPHAWLSIEEKDNNPARFLSAAAAACRTVNQEIGRQALSMLSSPQPPPVEKVIASLARDIIEENEEFLLLFDDFHLVRGRGVQETVALLLDRLPASVPLYITSRIDPSLPLAKLRARDQLVEIRAEDLQFTDSETALFFTAVMKLELTDPDIQILERRTEGWAAGLQMAALSLRRHSNPSSFIESFGGSNRYIMDYLIEEVLDGLSSDIRDFLLKTSVCRQLCASLAEELTGAVTSLSIIEELERDNIFLTALDESRKWYRYHHLFIELLQHRLALYCEQEEIDALHMKAGAWYEDSNDIEEAMYHCLKSENYQSAFRIIDEHLEAVLSKGGLGMLSAWKSKIPDQEIFLDANACVNAGIISAFTGQAAEAVRYFDRADTFLSESGNRIDSEKSRSLRGKTFTMRAFLANIAGKTVKALEYAEEAQRLLPETGAMTRSLIPYILGRIYRHRGELEKAEDCLQRQIKLALQADNTWSLSGGVHELIWICRLKGEMNKAEEILREYAPRFEKELSKGPIAKVIAVQAEIKRARARVKEASETAQKALQSVEGWGLPSDVCFCLHTQLRIELSAGRPEKALRILNRIDEITGSQPVHQSILPLYEAERVRIFLALGMVNEALQWMNGYRFIDKENIINREVIDIAKARIYIASGHKAKALVLLKESARAAEAGNRCGRLLEILLLQSQVEEDEKTAYRTLNRALELAGPEQSIQIFFDEDRTVMDRVRRAVKNPDQFSEEALQYARFLLSL